MALTLDDVRHIADLARIELPEEQAQKTLTELNDVFKMIEKIQAVDTTGLEPMPHPYDASQRLRRDAVTETNQREQNMQNAPEQSQGLFLVPQVIE